MTNTRDPRVDPKPGDIVYFGPQWQAERYAVLGGTSDKSVQYQLGPLRAVHHCTLDQWRGWAATAEVIHAAE